MAASGSNPFRIVQSADLHGFDAQSGAVPKIASLLIKPASAVCNLDCSYCFYLDRDADPYESARTRIMPADTLERLVETYLFYSFPASQFAFQGGEPTLAGLPYFRALVELQKRHGRLGQSVSNSIQTNGILLTREWCQLFRDYEFLVGLSLDGPQDVHDRYRVNKSGHGTWDAVMDAVSLLQRERVEFNVLSVVSQANVHRALETYQFFRGMAVDNLQFIPLVEFHPNGNRSPTPSQEMSTAGFCANFSKHGGPSGAPSEFAISTTSRKHLRESNPALARCMIAATAMPWSNTTVMCIRAIFSSNKAGG